jgi:lipopolysaccharide biosynthesis protein
MKIPRFNKKDNESVADRSDRYLYKIDEPRQKQISDRKVVVRGWILPKENLSVISMQLRHSGHINDVSYGFERRDIQQAFPDTFSDKSLKSGFEVKFEFVNGPTILEVDFGDGYEIVERLDFIYVGDKPLAKDYNPHFATNYAEHLDLRRVQKSYFYENASQKKIELKDSDPKVIALYLPQFHPIPENDRTWGKGFTEWTNVASAQPRFIGHNQPILPGDLGFYDLRYENNIFDQITLAKDHGIYGFCIYYYWFSGKKILDAPLQSIINHKEWDFNFMICWANENWTKRWDGHDNDVIIAQKYLKDDALNFIKDVEHILLDPRYIRKDGKPVLSVYRPEKLKDAYNFSKVWRDYFKEKHNLELHLVSVLGFENVDPKVHGFESAIDFVPLSLDFKSQYFAENKVPQVQKSNSLLDVNYEGAVYDYRKIVLNEGYLKARYDFHTYRSTMPSWDNDARKKGKGSSFFFNNPDLYGQWLDSAITNREENTDFVFINAWNEWAEGAMLEPTAHLGHAMLNRTAEIIAKHSLLSANKKNVPLYGVQRKSSVHVAVLVHLYYTDQWSYIQERLDNLGDTEFDLYVNIQNKDIAFIDTLKKYRKDVQVSIFENRGRDILPFVHTARRLDQLGYTSILKIHTKKSKHRDDGDKWFKELVNSLLPSKSIVSEVIAKLEGEMAHIGPKGHFVSLSEYIGSNAKGVTYLMNKITTSQNEDALLENIDSYGYFGGSMFWTSLEAIRPLLNAYLMAEDFESEAGQIDGTLAHAVERVIGYVAMNQGANLYKVSKRGISPIISKDILTDYKFAK